MQQNGQEQQERGRQQQAAEQQAQEGQPNSATVSAEVEQQLAAEQQRAEECMDLLRRTQADFVNYRRRMIQEQAEVRSGVARLVPVARAAEECGRLVDAAIRLPEERLRDAVRLHVVLEAFVAPVDAQPLHAS